MENYCCQKCKTTFLNARVEKCTPKNWAKTWTLSLGSQGLYNQQVEIAFGLVYPSLIVICTRCKNTSTKFSYLYWWPDDIRYVLSLPSVSEIRCMSIKSSWEEVDQLSCMVLHLAGSANKVSNETKYYLLKLKRDGLSPKCWKFDSCLQL